MMPIGPWQSQLRVLTPLSETGLVLMGIMGMLFFSLGCGSGPDLEQSAKSPVHVDVEARRPAELLSDYNLFTDLPNHVPNERVFSYELNASQFVDGAQVRYFIYVPHNQTVQYREEETLLFPIGTVLGQTLSFPKDERDLKLGETRIETRLLIHQNKGWVAVPYVWNRDLTDAKRSVVGSSTDLAWVDRDGTGQSMTFNTPDMNQCKRCHKSDDRVGPVGVKARNLNRMVESEGGIRNQLDLWKETGILEGVPADTSDIPKGVALDDAKSGSVEDRARTWLDINCANCHSPNGEAIVSGLDLTLEQDHPTKFGVYKPPVAAGRGSGGRQFSIEPGEPDASFLLYRLRSTDPSVMMPPLGRSRIDEIGSNLIEDWILEMKVDEELREAALNPMEAYKGALDGGDPEVGRTIFYEKFKCVACHTAEERGEGTVGPDLSDVGGRTEKEYLLESLVDPTANVVEGFETVLITTYDEEVFSGTLISEDANEVVLSNSTGGTVSISKSEIEEQRSSELSSMPSVANLLTVEEVGHLLQYLRQLRP